jgi:hypothetical protein
MGLSQTTVDVLAALVIYGVGSTALRVVLYMIRDKLREK